MLEICNVHKTFNLGTINEKHALNGVNLKLDAGDFVTVIGGNGAGKSNLPHACALADGDVVAKWKKQSLVLLIYCFWMNIGLNS